MIRTGPGQRLPPLFGGIHRQASLDRGIRRCGDPKLGQHPDRVQLAGRLDNPGQHQLAEDLISAGPIQPENLVGGPEGLPQMLGLARHDRRLIFAELSVVEIQGVLIGVQPLPSNGLEHLHLARGVRRADVLDLA